MRHPKIIVSGIALAAVAAAGGVTAAAAASSPPASHSGAATVRTASVTVGGKTETILVNAHGLPLYFYKPDTAAKSLVTGALAQLWPPLTSAAPAATGVSASRVAVLNDVNGRQVTYNGHPLYTFADDHAGQVTGQGVQGFFVATPALAAISTSSTSGTVPAAPSGGVGY
jgi:predicted lipoprotein with Yx(FWY)xxD motif